MSGYWVFHCQKCKLKVIGLVWRFYWLQLLLEQNFYQFYAHAKKTDQPAIELQDEEEEEQKVTTIRGAHDLKPENLSPISKYLYIIRCI